MRIASLILALVAATVGHAAELSVTSTPEGASVFVDDTYCGRAPLTVDVAEGGHLIRLARAGYRDHRARVDVPPEGAAATAELQLSAAGELTVTSQPTGADVYLDGEWRGKTPLTLTRLEQNYHTVQVTLEGYDVFEADVDLEEQPIAEVAAELGAHIEIFLLASIEANPKTPNNYADLAHHYFLRQRFEDAIATFARGFDMVAQYEGELPRDEVKRMYNESLYTYQGQYDFGGAEALQTVRPMIESLYQEALVRHPECGATAEWFGDLLTQAGRPAEAEVVYRSGVQNATDLVALIGLRGKLGSQVYAAAVALQTAGQTDQAIAAFKAITQEIPGHFAAINSRAQLANIHEAQNDNAAAAAEYRAIADESTESCTLASYLMTLGRYYLRLDDYASSVAAYEEIAAKRPDSGEAVAALNAAAPIYATNLAQPERAMACYDEVARIAEGTTPAVTALAAKLALLNAAGATDEAAALTARIVAEYPLSAVAFGFETDLERQATNTASLAAFQAAAALAGEGKNQEAADAYWAVLDQYPDTYYGRAAGNAAISILYSTIGDYPAAAAKREDFVQRFPDDETSASHLYYLGASYAAHLGEPEKAVAAYEALAERYPRDPVAPAALSSLGSIYESTLADPEKAVEVYVRLAREYPYSSYALSALYSAGNAYLSMFEVEKGRDFWRDLMTRAPGSAEASQAAVAMTYTRRRAGHGQWGEDGLGAVAEPGV